MESAFTLVTNAMVFTTAWMAQMSSIANNVYLINSIATPLVYAFQKQNYATAHMIVRMAQMRAIVTFANLVNINAGRQSINSLADA